MIILGSDYPFPLGEHHPGKLIDSITDWTDVLKVLLSVDYYFYMLSHRIK